MAQDGSARLAHGADFTVEYHTDGPFPYVHPITGPGGIPMTRGFPMSPGAHEAQDHPHHRSLWFAHGAVNGVDFWHQGGRIEHESFLSLVGAQSYAELTANARWVDGSGATVCRETRVVRIEDRGDEHLLDFEITLRAGNGPLVFGDTKEGSFALRLRPELRLDGPVAAGELRNSHRDRGADAWGKRARWVCYQALIAGDAMGAGNPMGVALFDHPKNPRHPTWWHARGYGLVAANPFGRRDFEGDSAPSGELRIPAGGQLQLRYRVLFYAGERSADELDKRWRAFAERD